MLETTVLNLSKQITVRREKQERNKPLRAGRFGPQFYSEKFTHLEVLLRIRQGI